MTRGVLAAALVAATALTGTAHAEPSAADRSIAQALFDAAKTLMADKNYASACPKFAESQRLDPGVGTLFKLSQCQELLGQTASAWSGYLDVAAMARSAGQPARETAAKAEALRIEPTLSRLSIMVPAPAAGLEVKRDGVVIGLAQWGLAMPTDPGVHTISAIAPGKKLWQTTVKLTKPGETVTATVPVLEAAPVAAVILTPVILAPENERAASMKGPEVVADAPNANRSRRIVAYIVGGVGLAFVGVGAGLGAETFAKKSASTPHCRPGTNLCDQTGVDDRAVALTVGNLSTAMFAVGGAAVAIGVVLLITAPSKRPPAKSAQNVASPSLSLSVLPSRVVLQGAW